MPMVVGREEEKEILQTMLSSNEAELVAVYGRRRVGKTFLIRNVFEKELIFDFSGIHNASMSQQLENFAQALSLSTGNKSNGEKPENWIKAFKHLADYTATLIKKKKQVIFFDEFPWIHTQKSGFIQAFEHFWNSWASKQKNLVVVICGSAAAWMINEVINNKGGLHNRVTRKIRLLPFTLQETAFFLKDRKINLDHYQLLQLYMVMGGVPHYLKEIKTGESASQAIDRICFTKDGLLQTEFKNLYQSLFDDAEKHLSIVRALAGKPAGLTRNELISKTSFTSGGWATKILEELTESGFVTAFTPFDKTSKDNIYKLTDEYSQFYLKFIDRSRSIGKGTWTTLSREASWKSWSGMAFETICQKHMVQIKKALGIAGVYTESSAWRYKSTAGNQGTQIDLLIDRQDFCINLCEMKFSISDFTIDKAYAASLNNKINTFREQTKTRKSIFLTMITTFGVKKNDYAIRLMQNEVTMDKLFTG